MPRVVANVVLPGVWGQTFNNQQYVLYQNNNTGVLVFLTNTDIPQLVRASMTYVDGTFKTAPRPYGPFFTIHGERNDHGLKFASGLLLNKDAATYVEVFQAISNRVLQITNQPWALREMITDYEVAIMSAAENVFPGIIIRGCHFHFTQALFRRVQRLGLARAYRQNQHVKRFLQKVFVLGFIPLQLVCINWNNLINSPNTQALVAQFPAL